MTADQAAGRVTTTPGQGDRPSGTTRETQDVTGSPAPAITVDREQLRAVVTWLAAQVPTAQNVEHAVERIVHLVQPAPGVVLTPEEANRVRNWFEGHAFEGANEPADDAIAARIEKAALRA